MIAGPPGDPGQLNALRWRSRRGLLELELLLAPFIDSQLAGLDAELIAACAVLLACDDLDVHEWLLGRSTPPTDQLCAIVAAIRAFHGAARPS